MISRLDSTKDVKSRKDNFYYALWVMIKFSNSNSRRYKTCLILNPYSFPKSIKIWPKKFFKTLNSWDAQEYTTLIITVAP